ncbi:hypothetical protein [Marivirga arenosa]|uniref:DUF998 domain-containing protein n=1 Tax=Marivirga arenosa TaxID=3059076 RepID=A0AA49GC13_9BACT|nr:hypothetical protein [Marivirga sp. BKB1-2]WKK80708.2 hypothetical protein QYS47_27050 [Marivirga sp. BKB1-2]
MIKKYLPYFPIFGLAIYLVVFSLAASDYPGGSQNHAIYEGYSFFHNFLCDVMNPVTEGGLVNEARGLAIVSHLILSLTMIIFFYILPDIFHWENRKTQLIRVFGVLTMTAFIFMYTSYHDAIVVVTALFGSIALIPFFIELTKYENKGFKKLAYACYLLSFVVFVIFVTKIGFYYLPFLQKIVFFLDAWWVIWVSVIVINKQTLVAERA